jgi:hypothetical protein
MVTIEDALLKSPNSLSLDGNKLSLVGKQISHIGLIPPSVCRSIRTLYISSNYLKSTQGLEQFVNLKCLSCANNSIRYLGELQWLRECRLIEKVSFIGNAVVSMPYYREYIICLCPNLVSLDSINVSWKEKLDAKSSSHKAQMFYNQLRVNDLRYCIVSHMCNLVYCHQELITKVFGKFRSILGSHILSSQDMDQNESLNERQSKLWVETIGSEKIENILRETLRGGNFRWLQISCSEDFDRSIQVVCSVMFIIPFLLFSILPLYNITESSLLYSCFKG